MGVNQFTAQQFIDNIPGSGGIITTIAKRVGCDWHTAKKYVTEFATVRQAYEDECNHMGDALESKAAAIAMQGDGPMLRFLLSTKWKDRGYTERQEHSGPGGETLKIRLTWGDEVAAGNGDNTPSAASRPAGSTE